MAKTTIAKAGKRIVRAALARAGFSLERLPLSVGWHLARLIDTHQIDGVLDVGANRGQFGTMLRQAGYRGPIVSFEPVHEAFVELAALAADDAAWSVRQLALGDQPGTLPLNVTRSSSVSSFLPPTEEYTKAYSGVHVDRVEDVRVATLNSLAGELPFNRILLKIDTQGFDLRVVAGAGELLPRTVAIEIEMSVIPIYEGSPSYLDAFTRMQELGFTPTGIFPVASDAKMRAYEFDGVFVRA
jgi:FkbM family methyltransferase